jgi:hypothetical protein
MEGYRKGDYNDTLMLAMLLVVPLAVLAITGAGLAMLRCLNHKKLWNNRSTLSP